MIVPDRGEGRRELGRHAPERRPRAPPGRTRCSGGCPTLKTPTFVVTSGQRPLSAWIRSTSSAPARIALRPFSGSTPACAARPLIVSRMSAIPLRADTKSPFARAHSSTKRRVRGRGDLADVRRRRRRPDLLVRVRDERQPLEREGPSQPPPSGPQRADRAQAGEQPALHVGDAGPGAIPPSIRNGRFATVPSENTVSMCPIRRTRGPAPAARRTSRSPCRRSGRRVRPALDRPAEPLELRRHPVADLVDPGRRVAAAVDVADPLELGEERGRPTWSSLGGESARPP